MQAPARSCRPPIIFITCLALAMTLICTEVHAQKVYWADLGEDTIRRADTDGSNVELLVSSDDAAWPTALAIDRQGGKIYWCGVSPNSVRRSNLDGSGVEILTTTGLDFPNGIALDIPNGHLYVSSYQNRQINRYDFDGSNYLAIHTFADGSWPRGIDLDLGAGKMYYQLQTAKRIERSNLDGSGIEVVVDATGNIPHDLALDVPGGKIYWVELDDDEIRRCNLDGSNVETVVDTGYRPRGLALDPTQEKIWWTKPLGAPASEIRRSNDDGTDVETILSGTPLSDPWGIEVDFRTIVYDNGYSDPTTGTGTEMSRWVQADDFELADPGTLSGLVLDWFEVTQGSWDGRAQWYIFSDSSGAPGALLYQGNGVNRSTQLIATDQGYFWHQTHLMFDNEVTLAAATRYWVGLHWGASGDFADVSVFWASTATGGFSTTGHESDGGTFDNWVDNSLHPAFRLLGGEACGLFCDGFESGDMSRWSVSSP